MTGAARLRPTLALLVLAAAPAPAAGQRGVAPEAPARLPATSLAVRDGREWRTWWSSAQAPAHWSAGDPVVQRAVRWEPLGNGLERGELELAGARLAARFRVILARLDPAAVTLRVRQATRDYGLRGAWNLDSASMDAILALNAGQFSGGDPWGWLVSAGRELQPPGAGALAVGVVLAGQGGFALLSPAELDAVRREGGVGEAFQSYPVLLELDGDVPAALRAAGRGVDVQHRDARLAICILRDARVLVALTRFAGMGEVLSNLPTGPTTPEMAALMGALGCRRAVMLDGGLSSQLLLRGAGGVTEMWPGLRRVPLALEAVPLAAASTGTLRPGR